MHKVWIEAALNGPWSRKFQPGIPDTVEAIIAEGIACARAGATIIHTHAYDGGGAQTYDWQVYARIIEGIRNEVDVPVYASYDALTLAGINTAIADTSVRFAHVTALVARGLIEFTNIDPGSVNFTRTTTTSETPPADTYLNPETHIRYALDFAARHGLHPDFAVYEPGFIRAGASLARAAAVKTPIYRLMFCDKVAVGFPPKLYALEAYMALLDDEAHGAPWMIAGVGADIRPLIGETVRRGGHVRVGLEDAPLGTRATNLEMVEEAIRLVREHGGEPASPA
ncbi:MAG: 3-keto-5-aminohexanoate cleavage protein, partial [Bradyrhizobium sp.]